MGRKFEIIDEGGNVHEAVAEEDIEKFVDDRALGEQCDDPDDDRASGWRLQIASTTLTARISK